MQLNIVFVNTTYPNVSVIPSLFKYMFWVWRFDILIDIYYTLILIQ